MFKPIKDSLKLTSSSRLIADTRGGVLIGAVVAMVVMGVLGAGMVSMLGTSSLTEVRANFGQRAYYLAESGFRYAVSTYIHGGSLSASLDALEGLHNRNDFLSGVHLDVEVEIYEASDEKFAESFTVVAGWTQFVDGSPQYIAAGDELGQGGNLLVNLGISPLPLPEYRGVVKIAGKEVRYQRFVGPVDTVAGNEYYWLRDISFQDPGDTLTFAQIDGKSGELVFPVEVAHITSKGTYPTTGLGSLLAVSRSVSYTWPLSGKFGGDTYNPPSADEQDFFNLPGLDDGSGSLVTDNRFEVDPGDKQQTASVHKNVDGDPGVRVKFENDVDQVFVNINWWNIEGFDVNDAYIYQYKTLTYDLQIKQKWGDHNQFDNFLTGLTFRIQSNDMLNDTYYGASLFHSRKDEDRQPGNVEKYPDWLNNSTSLSNLGKGMGETHLVFWKWDDKSDGDGKNIHVLASWPVSPDNDNRVDPASSSAIVDWATIVLRIEEQGVGDAKQNKIMAIIYNENENPRGAINWPPQFHDSTATDSYLHRGWDNPDLERSYTHAQQPELSTGTLLTIPETRPEIGFHAFSDFGAQNELQFDGFALRMLGSSSRTGNDYVPPIQQ